LRYPGRKSGSKGQGTTLSDIHIHQIFYDAASRAALDSGYIPLDNTANKRPDWYEFWVILQYLRTHRLEPGDWYGFVSPGVGWKTRLSPAVVKSTLAQLPDDRDALVLPTFLDQVAPFINQFEQGERRHKGLIAASEIFLRPLGYDLSKLVSHTFNSAYSNFVIGRKTYWDKWRELAERFFDYCESPNSPLRDLKTVYQETGKSDTPMKVFIQERLSSVVLYFGGLSVSGIDLGEQIQIVETHLRGRPEYQRLRALDELKQAYCATGDMIYLQAFSRLRGLLPKAPRA
jgi:hypothetical protein